MAYNKEWLLLNSCLEVYPSQDEKNKLSQLVKQELDWEKVLCLAKEQDILPLLCYNLSFLKQKIPQNIFSILEDDFNQTKEINLKLYNELKNIELCFKQNNVEFMLLKGIDIARRLYPDIAAHD